MSFELDLKGQSRSLTSKKQKQKQGTAGRRKQAYTQELGSDSLAQMVKDPLAMQETQVLSLGWEDPLCYAMLSRFSHVRLCVTP